MSDKKQRGLVAAAVYDLHLKFIRRVNDSVVFLQEAMPRLDAARSDLGEDDDLFLRRYQVPGTAGAKKSIRSHEQLRQIYDRFLTRELFENFLVTAVSQFESYLFSVLTVIIERYPQKLTLSTQGRAADESFSVKLLLNAADKEDAIKTVIKLRLASVSYASPKDYLKYVKVISGVNTEQDAFAKYIEIKATRDIIIHNGGIANDTYLDKSGTHARGNVGELLTVDEPYFDNSVAILKSCSEILTKGCDDIFPLKKPTLKASGTVGTDRRGK